ncbi:MAG: hypothetical protein ACXADH_12605, partial [Candidatus Kariarchaeaceae archaeon]
MQINRISLLLLGTIVSNHLYLLIRDTTSLHSIVVPSLEIWTFILLIPLSYLTYNLLNEPAVGLDVQSLYIAIFLSIGSTVLRIFDYTTEILTYSIFLLLLASGSIMGLIGIQRTIIRLYIILLGIRTFIFYNQNFDLKFGNSFIADLNILFEFILLISFLLYILHLSLKMDEFTVTSLAFTSGVIIGSWISDRDTPSLIFNVIINQTLSIGQAAWGVDRFGVSISINTDHFFMFHIGII